MGSIAFRDIYYIRCYRECFGSNTLKYNLFGLEKHGV